VIGEVIALGVADLMMREIFVATDIMAGEMMGAVARVVMARKSMPVKRVSGKSVRAKSAAHMDRTVGSEAMEAAKAMHAAAAK
jgi:hypothetical protein